MIHLKVIHQNHTSLRVWCTYTFILLFAAVTIGTGCSTELPDDSQWACESLFGENGGSTCEPSEPGCVLMACFASPADSVEPSCDGLTVAYATITNIYPRCSTDYLPMSSYSDCYPGWKRASFESERAQCLSEAQREEIFIMMWREEPVEDVSP